VNDEVDSVGVAHADLEELSGSARSNKHDQVVKLQDSDGVTVCVKDVVVMDAVFAGAGDDHRIHDVNLS
jgi:hypothetical protein